MNVAFLTLHEIVHRKASFALGAAGIAVIVAAVVCTAIVLNAFDRAEKASLAEKLAGTKAFMGQAQDSYRTIARSMGVIYRIIAPGQTTADYLSEGYARRLMKSDLPDNAIPAGSGVFESIVPALRQKVWWPEANRSVFICGIGESLPGGVAAKEESLHRPKADGRLVAGYELQREVSGKHRAPLVISGKRFAVDATIGQTGSADDITLWMTLKDAQSVLSCPNMISEIWVWPTLAGIESPELLATRLNELVKGATVIEQTSRKAVQARSLVTAARSSVAAIEREKKFQGRAAERRHRIMFLASWIGFIGGCIWVGIAAQGNITLRRHEIGVLRALGIATGPILRLLVCRSVLTGLTGSVAGCIFGIVWSACIRQNAMGPFEQLFTCVMSILTAVVACGFAAVPLAYRAVRKDPALVLSKA